MAEHRCYRCLVDGHCPDPVDPSPDWVTFEEIRTTWPVQPPSVLVRLLRISRLVRR